VAVSKLDTALSPARTVLTLRLAPVLLVVFVLVWPLAGFPWWPLVFVLALGVVLPPPGSDTPVNSRTAIDRLIARRDVHLREKTLYRMLYETAARSEEILSVNIEDLDLTGRTCPVKAEGAKPKTRRRGAVRQEYMLERVWWDAGTARLLPRLIAGRTSGPLFIGHRRPGPGKKIDARDMCPDTGRARLSYGQARALLDAHTRTGGARLRRAALLGRSAGPRNSATLRVGWQDAITIGWNPRHLWRCWMP
jgi:integrase